MPSEPPVPTEGQHISKPSDAEAMARILAVVGNVPANTARAYASDWRVWESWCLSRGERSLPVNAGRLVLFVDHQVAQGRKLGTLRRRVSGVLHHAQLKDPEMVDPRRTAGWRAYWKNLPRTLAKTAAGARRSVEEPARSISPATVRSMILALEEPKPEDPDDRAAQARFLRSVRDQAMLSLLLRLGARRGELTALDVDSIRMREDVLEVFITRRKTGRHGWTTIERVDDLACTVALLRRWLSVSGITEGPLFRKVTRWGIVTHANRADGTPQRLSGQAMWSIVRQAARRAGVDGSLYSPHSFRAGLVTWMRANGHSVEDVMELTGHTSADMVRRYTAAAGARHACLHLWASTKPV